jgi:signal transduction histidine kinase
MRIVDYIHLKKSFKLLLVVVFFMNSFFQLKAKEVLVFSNSTKLLNADSSIFFYEDKTNNLSFEEAKSMPYLSKGNSVTNLGVSKSTFWIRLSVYNSTYSQDLMMKIGSPMIDEIEFFYPDKFNEYHSVVTGEKEPFKNKKYQDPNFLFDLSIPNKTQKTYFLKISSIEDIVLPITIGTKDVTFNQLKKTDIFSGIYIGVMLVMILYNLFIYLSVRDKSYLYYVTYILLVLFVQTGFQGYFFQYLWPNYPGFSQYSIFLFSSLVGIAGMAFMNFFLRIEFYYKKLYLIAYTLSLIYLIPLVLPFFGLKNISWQILSINAGLVSLYMLVVSIMIVKKGYQPAKYFLAAWLIFLLGVIGFVLKNMGILPFNNFTRYTMQIGSAIETVLLSFALAARINIYKKEKEESQQKAVEALEENEKIIRNQNVILEQQVNERTADLNTTLNQLKQAQSELVEAEKMSSLGQLTAGIAHEINNSINFVSSNMLPLKHDVADVFAILNKYEELVKSDNVPVKLKEIEILKEELDYSCLITEIPEIINGIENGANRTIEIVDGLKNFSRLNEAEFKVADINVGIKSTLLMLRSKLGTINVNLKLGQLPEYECNPGKLNQVIMNFVDNAIYAIRARLKDEEGIIKIETSYTNELIIISVSDNGSGISKENISKLFEPFYTSKDIGEGTGLGLSIVKGIIDSHKGSIEVESREDKGTEFAVKLPIKK